MITSKKEFEETMTLVKKSINFSTIHNSLLYNLGYTFEYGLLENEDVVINSDNKKAFYWYEQAMINGNLDATIRLADFLSEGIGCEKDIDRSISLYLICIERGISIAANNLGKIYSDIKDYTRAFKYYTLTCELMSKEYNKTIYSLDKAICYLYGIGTLKDELEGFKQLNHLVSPNNNYSFPIEIDEANYLLGLIYLQGIVIPKDIDKARYYLLRADQNGDHSGAQILLSLIGRE